MIIAFQGDWRENIRKLSHYLLVNSPTVFEAGSRSLLELAYVRYFTDTSWKADAVPRHPWPIRE